MAIGILYLFNERNIKSIVSFVATYHGQLSTNTLIELLGSIRVILDFFSIIRNTSCMRYDEKPIYRKLIVPWYDSQRICLLVILLMFLVFWFALAGVSIAGESPEHRTMIWLPILLLVLSASVIISTAFRLIKRIRYRFSKDLSL